jgi:hypothetical protein
MRSWGPGRNVCRVARREGVTALGVACVEPASIGLAHVGSEPTGDKPSFPVLLLGCPARRALVSESSWKILAVFRRSVYCMSRRGAVVCVGHPSLGAGPLNVLAALPRDLDGRNRGLLPGAPVRRNGTMLHVDVRLAVSLAKGRLWRPTPPPSHWDPAVLAGNLDALAREIRRHAPAAGLTQAFPNLRTRTPRAGFGSELTGRLAHAAGPGIEALRTWLESVTSAEPSHEAPPAAVASLIGLGPGLTPSGDDVLGGALIALRALGWRDAADALARRTLARARSRTHAISYAHLVCATAGEGAAALHDTLVALCSPAAPRLGDCVEAVAAIGHSSGWDALAGLALVASAAIATGWAGASCRVTPQ